MASTLVFPDPLSVLDLRIFLGRAARVSVAQARLIASGDVLAVYAPILQRAGLLDAMPTVLGLRTFALAEPLQLDAVVPTPELAGATDTVSSVDVPAERVSAAWSGVSAPKSGWTLLGSMSIQELSDIASVGITEAAESVPGGTGEQLVQKARTAVWGRHTSYALPAGAAFAAQALGFLTGESATVHGSGAWLRLTTSSGHVLVR